MLWRNQAHLVNQRMARTRANQFDNLFDCIRFTLQQKFDTAIGKIMGVATKSMPVCRRAHKIAKANALHATAHSSFYAMHLAV